MIDTTPPSPAAFFALPDHAVLELAGRDALAFAQAQSMNDVAALADGRWQWNGWLTPKGRLVALFAALRRDADTLWLVLPDADARDIAQRLQRFVFRSKLAIAVRDDLHVAGRFASPVDAAGDASAASGADGVDLDVGGEGGPRTLRVGASPAAEDAAALARWRGFDLAHGLPRLDASQGERWTPQQLSLERLRAYSVKKGCYPGQEIVARTHFLGQAKRGLALLHTPRTVPAGAEVRAANGALGEVVSSAGLPSPAALAVLPRDVDAEGLTIDGVEARFTGLLGGLAR